MTKKLRGTNQYIERIQRPIKVYHGDVHVDTFKLPSLSKVIHRPLGRYQDGAEWLFRRLTLGLFVIIGAWMFVSIVSEHYSNVWAQTAYAEAPVMIKDFPPILHKICTAESGGKQFAKSGKVISHKNTDGTTDYGICQINSTHLERAKSLGYDVIKSEKDNKAFARVLFMEQGSVPWRSSAYGKNGWINK